MPSRAIAPVQDLRVAVSPGGVTLVPRPTPLTRLHYYDGKFLRASDLQLEQRYQQQLVAYANQAGGAGVVQGYDAVWTGGDRLELGPGLAIDPQGRTLLTLEPAALSIAELIGASRSAVGLGLTASGPKAVGRAVFSDCEPLGEDGDGGTFADGGSLYVVTLFHAEALCGTEDVFGRLCAEACVTSTERPFILEGVIVRAVPWRRESSLPTSARVAITSRHLRSLVASAYFEDEWRRGGSLISAAGLESDAWCLGAAAQGGLGVPIGLVARAGDSTLFFDAWTARRERIEPPSRRFWAGRMAMRPWDVFLAQVLQFQCQLAHCLDSHGEPEEDPCRPAVELLRQTSEELARWLGAAAPEAVAGRKAAADTAEDARFANLEQIRGRLVDAAATLTAAPATRFLLGCGITELPAAGYLPVLPSATLTVNEQVRRLTGEGVDLRFCVVRPDFVAHALEEAQHMERISLLAGLDDPAKKPQVDILVPDGAIDTRGVTAPGQGYEIELSVAQSVIARFAALATPRNVVSDATDSSNPTTASTARVLGSFLRTMATSGTNPGAPIEDEFLTFSGAGRGEDLADGGWAFHLAGRASGSRTGSAASARSTASGGLTGVSFPQTDSVWLSVSIDRDPFGLGVHEQAGVSAEGVLAYGENRTLELDFHGDLGVVDRATAPGGGARLTARLVGRLVVTLDSNAGATRTVRLQEEVRFERASDNAVTVSLPTLLGAPSLGVQAERRWPEATRAQVTGSLEYLPLSASKVVVPFLHIDERKNAEVARADHPAHAAAIAALQRLGQAVGEPGFADPRARRLFPPLLPATGELKVRATRDWVLFHRRRTKVCGIDTPAPQTAARRYRLYRLLLHDLGERGTLQEILQKGGSLDRFEPKAVGTVEFAGGLASVETAHPIVRDTWDAATPDGVEIVFGAIASQGDALADGETLAAARLDTLAGVLAPVTERAADAPFDVLSDLPPDLPALGADGAVLYATVAAQATVCHTVLLLRAFIPLSLLAERAKEVTTERGFRPEAFAQFSLVELDNVSFSAGTTQPVSGAFDTLQGEFLAALPGGPPDGFSLAAFTVSAFDASVAEHSLHRDQGERMVKFLGGVGIVKDVTAGGNQPLPYGCPAVTLLCQIRSSELPDNTKAATDSTDATSSSTAKMEPAKTGPVKTESTKAEPAKATGPAPTQEKKKP